MLPTHEMSQSGGYHYFHIPSARQLQRFVMRRRDTDNARRDASAHATKRSYFDPAPGRWLESDWAWSRRAAERPNEFLAIRGPGCTWPRTVTLNSLLGRRAYAASLLMMRTDR
jgi:hypothetical protein